MQDVCLMHSIQFTAKNELYCVPVKASRSDSRVGSSIVHPSCPFRYQKTKQAIFERTGSWKTSQETPVKVYIYLSNIQNYYCYFRTRILWDNNASSQLAINKCLVFKGNKCRRKEIKTFRCLVFGGGSSYNKILKQEMWCYRIRNHLH